MKHFCHQLVLNHRIVVNNPICCSLGKSVVELSSYDQVACQQ